MQTEPHWTAYVSALLVPVVALVGAAIAYRQWRVASLKLKFDLFDRRFAVYEAARNLLGSILTSGHAKDEEVFKFLVGTREAKWLLNEQVANYLEKELYFKVIDLQTNQAELQGLPAGEERAALVRRQAEAKKWLMAQHEQLTTLFNPFLQLSHEA
jgi:hypothetical protein